MCPKCPMKYISFLFLIMTSVSSMAEAKKCSCVPLRLTFQLNSTSGCTQSFNEGAQTGISDSFCLIREATFQKDIVPVTINTIKIFELKSDLSTIRFPTVLRSLLIGDIFEFAFSNQTNTTIAGGIQFMIKGENKNGDTVTQDSIVSFTNNCSSLVFHEGDQVGFLTVIALGHPSSDLCPTSTKDSSSTISFSDSSGGCKYSSDSEGCNGNSNGESSGCNNGDCGDSHYGDNSYNGSETNNGSSQEDDANSDIASGNGGSSKGNSWGSDYFYSFSY